MRALIVPLLLGVSAACPRDAPPAAAEVTFGGATMGSRWEVRISHLATAAARAEAAALVGPVQALLDDVNARMSTYQPQSEVSRFNAQRSTAPFAISADTAAVIRAARNVSAATDGRFDITLDPLIQLWGFDRAGRRTAPPSAEEIRAALAHTGTDTIALERAADGTWTVRKVDPEATINLGGLASGYAADRVAAWLLERGHHNFLVDVTGELVARGQNDRGLPWQVGVRLPRSDVSARVDESAVLTRVALDGRALTTSGSTRNFFTAGGRRFSHILDPTTGGPVDTDLVSVSVVADSALRADALDTALLLVGEDKARAILATLPGVDALFVYADGGSDDDAMRWRISTTAGFPPTDPLP